MYEQYVDGDILHDTYYGDSFIFTEKKWGVTVRACWSRFVKIGETIWRGKIFTPVDGCGKCEHCKAVQFGKTKHERCLQCSITSTSIPVSLYPVIWRGATLINCPRRS